MKKSILLLGLFVVVASTFGQADTNVKIEKKNESLVHEKYLRLEIVEKIFEIMEEDYVSPIGGRG